MAAAMLAGPAAQVAGAQPNGSTSGSGAPDIASESPANRAIDGAPGAQLELKLGSAGQAVAAVQRRLGVEPDDGHFRESTDRAVRVFQGNAGLEVDGIVGPLTWQALFGGGTGGGTGPAANTSGSTPVLVPAVNGEEQATKFAVRRASESELEQLNIGGPDLPQPTGEDSGLAAIEFRIPDDGGESASVSGSAPGGGEARSAGSGVSGDSAGSGSGSASDGGESGSSSNGDSGAGSGSAGEDGTSGGEQPAGEQPSSGDNASDRDNGAPSGACGDSLRWPTDGKFVTSPFGPRGGRLHAGMDIDTGTGDRIRAAACGVISFMQTPSQSGGYGNFICVKHTDEFVTCYAHLSRFANVRVGDYVQAGETIGYSGCTGSCFGDHLHFEARRGNPYGGEPMDPRPFLDGRSIPGTPVRASSIGGPDLQEPQQPQVKSASASSQPASAGAVSAAQADSERSAVQVATDDGSASADGSAQGSQEVAAPSETAEQPAAKPAAIQPADSSEPAEATTPAELELGDEGQGATGDAAARDAGEATGSPADEQATGDEPVLEEASDPASAGEAGTEEPSSDGGTASEDEATAGDQGLSDSPSTSDSSGDEAAAGGSDAARDDGSSEADGADSSSGGNSSSTNGSASAGADGGSGNDSTGSGVSGAPSSTGTTTAPASPAQSGSTASQGAAGGQASTGGSTSASGASGATAASGSAGGASSTASTGASAGGSSAGASADDASGAKESGQEGAGA